MMTQKRGSDHRTHIALEPRTPVSRPATPGYLTISRWLPLMRDIGIIRVVPYAPDRRRAGALAGVRLVCQNLVAPPYSTGRG
jgi:hypothetical protein